MGSIKTFFSSTFPGWLRDLFAWLLESLEALWVNIQIWALEQAVALVGLLPVEALVTQLNQLFAVLDGNVLYFVHLLAVPQSMAIISAALGIAFVVRIVGWMLS